MDCRAHEILKQNLEGVGLALAAHHLGISKALLERWRTTGKSRRRRPRKSGRSGKDSKSVGERFVLSAEQGHYQVSASTLSQLPKASCSSS